MNVPVISVYQTDIIFYGDNLEDYFEEEFRMDNSIQNFHLEGEAKNKESESEQKIQDNKDIYNNNNENKNDDIKNEQNEDNIEKEESNNAQEPADLHYKYIPFLEEIINYRFEDEDDDEI